MKWIIYLLAMVIFEALANILAKKWSLSGSYKLLLYALTFFLITNTFWLLALKNGAGLARGIIFFSITSTILGVTIGVLVFKENLSIFQITGILLGIISIFIISFGK